MKEAQDERNTPHREPRLFYIDNIRIYLTILVLLHHIAIGYGGSGDWIIKEAPTDPISPILLTLFNALNQSYFMSLFFLLSGFFVPSSLDRKGAWRFLKDRLIRLGVPIILFALFFARIVDYILLNYVHHKPVTMVEVFSLWLKNPNFYTGPLWFVEVLLFFSLIYLIWHICWSRLIKKSPPLPYFNRFPSTLAVTLTILTLSATTYLVRIWYPVGVIWHHYQLAHYVHYTFCFSMGICAYRGKWLSTLSQKVSTIWKRTALTSTIVLPIIFLIMMSLGFTIEEAMGGGTWTSFTVAVWESVSCISISIWLLAFFQTRFNSQGRLARAMSPNAYTVYIIHQPLIGAIMAVFLSFTLPSLLKLFLVSLISILVCFITSHFIIRKLPFSKRVLG